MKEPVQFLRFFILGTVLAVVSCSELSDADVNKIRINSPAFGSPLYRIVIPHGSSYTIVCPQGQLTDSDPVTEGVVSYLDTPNHLSCSHPFPDMNVAMTFGRGITVLLMSARYAKLEPSGTCMDTFACDTEMTSQCSRYTSQSCALTAHDTLQLPGCKERPLIVEYDCRRAPVMQI